MIVRSSSFRNIQHARHQESAHLVAKDMGVRCQRFSLLVENGVVKQVNVEGVGPVNCSFAENMLAQLG